MWGLFAGLVIGVLQVMALSILGKMILGGSARAKLAGVVLMIAKIAVIVLILYLIATVSLAHVMWAAGGMLAGLILALVVLQIRRAKKDAAAGGRVDGKDGSDV